MCRQNPHSWLAMLQEKLPLSPCFREECLQKRGTKEKSNAEIAKQSATREGARTSPKSKAEQMQTDKCKVWSAGNSLQCLFRLPKKNNRLLEGSTCLHYCTCVHTLFIFEPRTKTSYRITLELK